MLRNARETLDLAPQNSALPRKTDITMFKTLNKLFYITAYSVIFVATVVAGINYVLIKNKQTLVQRDIDAIQKETSKNNNLLNQYKAELQNTSNRFLLKKRVKSMNTDLTPIQQTNVVTIPSLNTPSLAGKE